MTLLSKIWKSAEVVAVPKINQPRAVETDLRPIALLPVLAKVFEGFVRRWLMNSLLPTFDDVQFGCLSGRSTAHAPTSIMHTWQSALDKGCSVRALLIDFSKIIISDISNYTEQVFYLRYPK